MALQPITLAASSDGAVIFIGTDKGTFRTYDISDRKNPRCIRQLKFYENGEPITSIKTSEDGQVTLVGSNKSDTIFVMAQQAKDDFQIWGFLKAYGYVLDIAYTSNNNELCALALLSNNLVESFYVPINFKGNRLEPVSDDIIRPGIRKIDLGSDLIWSSTWYRQYLVAGDDLVLK